MWVKEPTSGCGNVGLADPLSPFRRKLDILNVILTPSLPLPRCRRSYVVTDSTYYSLKKRNYSVLIFKMRYFIYIYIAVLYIWSRVFVLVQYLFINIRVFCCVHNFKYIYLCYVNEPVLAYLWRRGILLQYHFTPYLSFFSINFNSLFEHSLMHRLIITL